MKNELVSIIIPVYNSEKYLEEAINSARNQSYTNIEIILVDDGSTDRSPVICDTFARLDNRIRVIHQRNSGPSAARNRGIDEAKGEYITFFDNDDLLHVDFIKILSGLCDQYDCDIALTKSFPFLDEATIPYGKPEEKLTFMDKRQLSIQLLDMGWTGLAVTMAKIFKKSLFEKIRFNEERIIGDDDSTIYLLYWESEKSVLFHSPLYFYRSKRKGSITHSSYQLSWLTGVYAFKERMEFYYAQGEKLLYAKAMRNYCRGLSKNYIQVKENYPKRKDILKQISMENKKQTLRMLFLKGNTWKQKISGLMFAWFPNIWNKVYFEMQRSGK
ncbi:MAG: glycosyltransferase family 2 protein [Lachnospiraceae bacterium]|nr:glycosyltransferase family 2 protein [Lachnospiraceae bacterium]